MKVPSAGAAVIVSLLLLVGCREPESRTPAGKGSTDATYIFLGTVTGPERTAVEPPDADSQAQAVRVDEIYYQKGTFEDQTGRTIMVLDESGALQAGRQYVFFTEPFAFGPSIAVVLIEASEDRRAGAKMGEEVKQAQELRAIRERLLQAETVVSGRVVSVRPFEGRVQRISEHVPGLHWAVVQVDRVLKGDLQEQEVSFLFAASIDIHWYRAPKFKEGDEGIFLLSRATKALEAFDVDARELTLLHAMDAQPTEKMRAVEAVLRGETGG